MIRQTKQPTLKPQDLVVTLKVACNPTSLFTYSQLSAELGLAASEIHSSLKRAANARLIALTPEGHEVIRPALKEFLLFGAKYCFPPLTGPATRGLTTGHAASPLKEMLAQGDDLPPVWPHPDGPTRGFALYPLYPNVTLAALRDTALYELLALFDGLRVGAAREREIAQRILGERL